MIPLIIAAIVSVGIIIGINVSKNISNKVVFAENLYCKYDKLSLRAGATYNLSSNEIVLEPANCTQRILYNSDNSNILEVDAFTGELKTKSAGECNLIATVKSSEVTNITIKIKVEIFNESNTNTLDEKIKNLQLNLSDCFAMLEYETNCNYADCSAPEILNGDKVVEITSFAYKRIYISLKQAGEAQIMIETAREKIIFNITVTDDNA